MKTSRLFRLGVLVAAPLLIQCGGHTKFSGGHVSFKKAEDSRSDGNRPPVINNEPLKLLQQKISSVDLEVTIRDFNAGLQINPHPDFQPANPVDGLRAGLVEQMLGPDQKPVLVAGPMHAEITSVDSFNQWYRDVPGVNTSTKKTLPFVLVDAAKGVYRYENTSFFIIDGELFGNYPPIVAGAVTFDHNYHFTLESHTKMFYRGGETLSFYGDDDVWIYINGKLVIDLGGIHNSVSGSVDLDSLGLEKNQHYDIDIFFAERNAVKSTFKLETTARFGAASYQYPLNVVDPDGDAISIKVVKGPDGMAYDSKSGALTWNPTSVDQSGMHTIIIQASDDKGGMTELAYDLEVSLE